MARTTPKQPTLTERVDEFRTELDQTEIGRKRDLDQLRTSMANNTEAITKLTASVQKISDNINGFSMESFSDTLDKLVLLIDGDDSRDVTGLRKRMRDSETVQTEQNKSLARIEKKITSLGAIVIIASIIMNIVGEGGAVDLIQAIAKLFALP